MLVLALDTALGAATVALSDGGRLIAVRCEPMERGQQERLGVLVAETMAEAGKAFSALGRIGVAVGPGSFTGVRVGLAFAKGLALAWETPLVGVSSLHALAETAGGAGVVAAAIDARRGRVYLQRFLGGAPLEPPELAEIDAARSTLAGQGAELEAVVGSGAALIAQHRPGLKIDPRGYPEPAALISLAEAVPGPTEPPSPLYLRGPDAKTLVERGL